MTPKEKTIIDRYLKEATNKLQYELNFNMTDDYVALSGQPGNPHSLMTQQAYEEKDGSSRIRIDNLDNYLLFPSSPRVFIYGPPGSGKSTTLYKALINHSKKFYDRKGYFIPVFMHANDVENALNLARSKNENSILGLIEFVQKGYGNKLPAFVDFVSLCKRKPSLNFVIIVDALDEFLNKERRGSLFKYLSDLMRIDSKVRWILSCREEEYKAYAKSLNVTNIKIRPMNMYQVKSLLKKRLRSYMHDPQTQNRIRRTILGILEAERLQEAFLRNPYYLSLWLDQVSRSTRHEDTEDSLRRIPSVEGLHRLELDREIKKEGQKSDPLVLQCQLEVLSVLSFYLLQASLASKGLSSQRVGLDFPEILQSLMIKHEELNYKRVIDSTTCKRISLYKNELTSTSMISGIRESYDKDFVEIVETLKNIVNKVQLSFRVYEEKAEFLITVGSILEQAYRYRLIDLDISTLSFSKFLNQRAGDYLAAKFLVEHRLASMLQSGSINFWLFRTIAISIAISEEPQKILDPATVAKDPVLATAVVNGLALVKSTNRHLLRGFAKRFVDYLLDKQNFSPSHKAYDVCSPLRSLRAVSRLSSNGYGDFFILPDKLFNKLLKFPDTSIADAAAITLLTHASRVEFRMSTWMMLFKYFLVKSLRFELSRKAFNGFTTTIYSGVIGD